MTRRIDLTDEQVATIRRMWSTHTLSEIAAVTGISRSCVSVKGLTVLGLPRRQLGSRMVNGTVAAALYAEGMSLQQIGRECGGVSHGTIARVLRQRGVKIRPTNTKVEDDPRTPAIVQLFKLGWRQREIADKFGMTEKEVGYRCRQVLGSRKRGGDQRSRKRV